MKKHVLIIFVLNLVFIVLPFNAIFAQGVLVEILLQKQIEESELVVEGKVIAKESLWDSKHQNIYTKNTVEVYKVFKGEIFTQIVIITKGGVVGLKAQKVTPSLQLSKNNIGLFLLNTSNIQFLNDKNGFKNFSPYSGIQGFYKYDNLLNKASNVFKSFNDVEGVLYDSIKSITKINYREVVKKKFAGVDTFNNANKNSLAVGISNITPNPITAGTKSILTINGSGFGTGIGSIGFSNADDGGATLYSPLDTQIVSWSDAIIQVEVPSEAGTGVVRVTHQFDGTFDEANLSISYSEINAESDALSSGMFVAYQTQHINANLSGGYTWQMHTEFNANTSAKESFIRAFDTWRCETGVNWVLGSTTGIDIAANDGTNVIRFDNGAELASGTLGVNSSWLSGCIIGGTVVEWYVSELDIVFNDTSNWEFGPTLPNVTEVDFESVAVHELGHGHQLGHVIDSNAIMHFSISNGESNRALSANDIAGAGDVHSRSTTLTPCGEASMTNYDNSSCALNTKDNELYANIYIYPNPNSGEFFLKKTSFINLEKAVVYDINGRLISTHDISDGLNIKTINLDNVSNGVYFLSVHSDTAAITKKIIIK